MTAWGITVFFQSTIIVMTYFIICLAVKRLLIHGRDYLLLITIDWKHCCSIPLGLWTRFDNAHV